MSEADDDWLIRSRAPGVFWACNGAEFVRGLPGYTSQPVLGYPTGIVGQLITPIESIADHPGSEELTLASSKWSGDIGDGHGAMKHTLYPNVSGKVLHIRRGVVDPVGAAEGAGDWNVMPWAYVPEDYVDAVQGTGQPNERRGIRGTSGEGQIFPFLETEITDGVTSKRNPRNRPMVRHFFLQFLLCPFDDWLYYSNRQFFSPPWTTGVSIGYRTNKIVFVNGGDAYDQFAILLSHTFALTALQQRNGAYGGYSRSVVVKGGSQLGLIHTAIDTGGDPVASGARSEDWMRRYGPMTRAFTMGTGVYPDGVTPAAPEWRWRHAAHPDLTTLDISYLRANQLDAPDNNYPYGGFVRDGRPPFPELDLPADCTAGLLRSDTPMVVQIMISDQINAPVNQDAIISWPGVTLGYGPRITAMWASKLGDPPTLLAYTGSNPDKNGPAIYPSRAFHRSSASTLTSEISTGDAPTQFKIQENAIDEDRANCGFMIVGALDGFPEPTTQEFYALRANPSGGLLGQYVAIRTNKAVNPGSVENFGCGLGMGWAIGDLESLDVPAVSEQKWQYRIERTWFTGQTVTVPNAYSTTLAPVTAAVHKFRLATATSVAPRAREAGYAGDCINVLFTNEDGRPLGRQLGFGEVLFGLEWIPWPRHPTVEMPWPAAWTEPESPMGLTPTKTSFTVVPSGGVMDTRVIPPPSGLTAPAWAADMTVGVWYQVATDAPQLGLSATAEGTRVANDVNPANFLATNPSYPSSPPYAGETNFPSLFGAWNSGVFAPLGAAGSMLYYGGGHRAYLGNEVIRFDIATREFSRLTDPSVAGPFTLQAPGATLTNGGYDPEPADWAHGPQTPCPPHTYFHLQFCPKTNSLICFKAQATTISPDVGSSNLPIPWMLNLTTLQWRRGVQGTLAATQCGNVWDDTRQAHLQMDTNNDWAAFDPVGENSDGSYGSWAATISGTGTTQTSQCPVIDYARNMVVIQQYRATGVKIRTRALDDLGTVTVNPTLNSPPVLSGPSSWSWSDTLDGVVTHLSGTTDVYLVTTADDWASCDFALLTTSANGHALPSSNGIFQRFRTIDYADGTVLHVGVLGASSGAYAMRLA